MCNMPYNIHMKKEENNILLGMDNFPCFIMIVKTELKVSDAISAIKDFVGEKNRVFEYEGCAAAVVGYDEKTAKDYRSPSNYAEYAARFLYEETGKTAKIFIGSKAENPSDVAHSLYEAKRTSELFDGERKTESVHSCQECLFSDLLKSVSKKESDKLVADIGKNPLDDESFITAIEFLRNDLNVCETARKLFIHRNTLNYRLDKIEKRTGLDLRKFTHAAVFYAYAFLTEHERGKNEK